MPLFWKHTYSVDTISYLYIFTALSVPNSPSKTHVSMQHQQTLTRLKAVQKKVQYNVKRFKFDYRKAGNVISLGHAWEILR